MSTVTGLRLAAKRWATVVPGLLGRRVGITIDLEEWADPQEHGVQAARIFVREVERLQALFDIVSPDSELWRWHRGECTAGPELQAVLDLADHWRELTDGAFHPGVGTLFARWELAAENNVLPLQTELEQLASRVGTVLLDSQPPPHLDVLTKGWIVDRALELVEASSGVCGVAIDLGGDLVRRGLPAAVDVRDGMVDDENMPLLASLELPSGALASSGLQVRGWNIDGANYSRVLDPRTGWPGDHIAQASAVAHSAATAGVVALALGVLSVHDGQRFVEHLGHEGVLGVMVVDIDGRMWRDAGWLDLEMS